ncbi:hypothetical protein ABVT39_022010 [Epinephelus coioides]
MSDDTATVVDARAPYKKRRRVGSGLVTPENREFELELEGVNGYVYNVKYQDSVVTLSAATGRSMVPGVETWTWVSKTGPEMYRIETDRFNKRREDFIFLSVCKDRESVIASRGRDAWGQQPYPLTLQEHDEWFKTVFFIQWCDWRSLQKLFDEADKGIRRDRILSSYQSVRKRLLFDDEQANARGSVLISTCDDDDTRGCWENDCGGVEPCTPYMNPLEALHVKKKKEKKEEEKGHVSTLSLTKDDVDTIKDFLSRCQYHAGWEKTKALCSGCKISHPSQRRHSCLFEFDQIRCMYFDQILDSVFKQSLGKALHYLFAQISPGAFSQDRLLGAAETLRHYLRPGCDGISANEEMETVEDHKHETALRNAFTVWTKCCCSCISTDL